MNEGTLLAIVIPSATVLAGILLNNHRINDVHQRFNDLTQQLDARFTNLEKLIELQIQTVRTELRRVEEVMDARLTRIEQELKLR